MMADSTAQYDSGAFMEVQTPFSSDQAKSSPVTAAMILLAVALLTASAFGCSATSSVRSGRQSHLTGKKSNVEPPSVHQFTTPSCIAPSGITEFQEFGPTMQVPVASPGEQPVPPETASEPADDSVNTPAGVPEIPLFTNPEPTTSSSEELNQCQSQLTDLSSRFSILEATHLKSQQALAALLAEQQQLKLDNAKLEEELERNHVEDIESLESLSQILEEVVTATTATGSPIAPSSTASPSTGKPVPSAMPLPAVDAL